MGSGSSSWEEKEEAEEAHLVASASIDCRHVPFSISISIAVSVSTPHPLRFLGRFGLLVGLTGLSLSLSLSFSSS